MDQALCQGLNEHQPVPMEITACCCLLNHARVRVMYIYHMNDCHIIPIQHLFY